VDGPPRRPRALTCTARGRSSAPPTGADVYCRADLAAETTDRKPRFATDQADLFLAGGRAGPASGCGWLGVSRRCPASRRGLRPDAPGRRHPPADVAAGAVRALRAVYRISSCLMIAKTFFLAKDSRRISIESLREKNSLRDHDLHRYPEDRTYHDSGLRGPRARRAWRGGSGLRGPRARQAGLRERRQRSLGRVGAFRSLTRRRQRSSGRVGAFRSLTRRRQRSSGRVGAFRSLTRRRHRAPGTRSPVAFDRSSLGIAHLVAGGDEAGELA
jgi:hypothetical protein